MPPLGGEGDPGRVVEVRDGVEELGAGVPRRREPGYGLLERLRDQPVVVHRHVHDVGLVGREGAEGAHVGRRLDQHHVAGVDEDPGHQVEGLLGADGDHDLVRVGADLLQRHDVADVAPAVPRHPARCSTAARSRPG